MGGVDQRRLHARVSITQMKRRVDRIGIDSGEVFQDLLDHSRPAKQTTEKRLADKQIDEAAADRRGRAAEGNAEERAKRGPDGELQDQGAETLQDLGG